MHHDGEADGNAEDILLDLAVHIFECGGGRGVTPECLAKIASRNQLWAPPLPLTFHPLTPKQVEAIANSWRMVRREARGSGGLSTFIFDYLRSDEIEPHKIAEGHDVHRRVCKICSRNI
jgi:hypothetical protein